MRNSKLQKDERFALVAMIVFFFVGVGIVYSGMYDVVPGIPESIFGVAFASMILIAVAAFWAFWLGHAWGIKTPATSSVTRNVYGWFLGCISGLIGIGWNIHSGMTKTSDSLAMCLVGAVICGALSTFRAYMFGLWRARGIAAENAREADNAVGV